MADVVPFGKYRGQPVEVLMADTGYRDWAMAQPWFKEKYPAIYQVVINYTGQPAETPEHNSMQASFLDDERCLRLSALLYGGTRLKAQPEIDPRWRDYVSVTAVDRELSYRQFECDGWDVEFAVSPAYFVLKLVGQPPCTCVCDHAQDCPRSATCNGGEARTCTHSHHNAERRQEHPDWVTHCDDVCPWQARVEGRYSSQSVPQWLDGELTITREVRGTVHVELKPDLGDDFPAVLRQVQRYEGLGRRVVVVRRHGFESVTWDQVAEMFAASSVALVDEAWLNATELKEA